MLNEMSTEVMLASLSSLSALTFSRAMRRPRCAAGSCPTAVSWRCRLHAQVSAAAFAPPLLACADRTLWLSRAQTAGGTCGGESWPRRRLTTEQVGGADEAEWPELKTAVSVVVAVVVVAAVAVVVVVDVVSAAAAAAAAAAVAAAAAAVV